MFSLRKLIKNELLNVKMVRNFKELSVWKDAMDLVEEIYGVIVGFPQEEIYSLSQQLKKAVVSIVSNIAEGCGRRTDKDFISFLYNALGSVKEVECQLIVAKRLGYLSDGDFEKLDNEVDKLGRMLVKFIKCVGENET